MIFLLQACGSGDDGCSFKYIDPQKKVFSVEGCMKDSLEDGLWTIYDSAKNIVEQGSFEKGIRTGKWRYPARRTADSVIEWTKYEDDRLAFITNIPRLFTSHRDSGDVAVWKTADTAGNLSVEIEIYTVPDSVANTDFTARLDSVFSSWNETRFATKQWFVTRTTNKVTFRNVPYFVGHFEVADARDKEFQALQCFSVLNGRKIVNIFMTFDGAQSELASAIFGSIVSNFFLNGDRFIAPFNEIHKTVNTGTDTTAVQ
jgi:hypothetical protein